MGTTVPLTRENVTAASRIMLPTYVAFFAIVGFTYAFAPPHATLGTSTALRFADQLMPLPAWGGLFLACAAIMAVALAVHARLLYRWALRMCAVSMFVWAAVIGCASIMGAASPGAWAWSAFVTAACLASDRSLAAREV